MLWSSTYAPGRCSVPRNLSSTSLSFGDCDNGRGASLAEAREKRAAAKRLIAACIDPVLHRD